MQNMYYIGLDVSKHCLNEDRVCGGGYAQQDLRFVSLHCYPADCHFVGETEISLTAR